MSRITSLSLLFVAGTLFVAPAAEARREAHGPERGLDSLNQPVVQRTDYVLDVAAPSGNISAIEKRRLRAWFDSLDLGYGDRVFVDEPYGAGPGSADVARVAAEYGLLLSEGAPVTPGAIDPGSVRVVVSRSTASVPGCPFADNYRGPSSTSANYGCSVNSNLAAMIADPSDLVLGHAGRGRRDDIAGTKAIKVYRDTPPSGSKGLQQTTTTGGH
ncbi:MAG TPA: CpaD family pilus assembly lipoprotein [Allosphingosinicella sp.]|jgi:pilus assembly protein CpaD